VPVLVVVVVVVVVGVVQQVQQLEVQQMSQSPFVQTYLRSLVDRASCASVQCDTVAFDIAYREPAAPQIVVQDRLETCPDWWCDCCVAIAASRAPQYVQEYAC